MKYFLNGTEASLGAKIESGAEIGQIGHSWAETN
jgi:hypothetical protein